MLLTLLAQSTPCADAYTAIHNLIHHHADQGLHHKPTLYPDRNYYEPMLFSNWLRLPGRHLKYDHWTLVYTDLGWLSGTEAIDAILSTRPSEIQLGPKLKLNPIHASAAPPPPRLRIAW
jgi:hypothetical protein